MIRAPNLLRLETLNLLLKDLHGFFAFLVVNSELMFEVVKGLTAFSLRAIGSKSILFFFHYKFHI